MIARRLGPLAALTVALVIGCSALLAPPGRAASGASDADPRATYLADCATCHGGDGQGTSRGPSLVGSGAASIDYELTTGRMPLDPVRGSSPTRRPPAYAPDEVRALVAYVDALTGGGGPTIPAIDPGSVAAGGTQFRLQCAACHEWAGDGGALIDREAPDLHRSTPVQIAEAIRTGPGRMPRFGGAALTDQQVDDVVAYVGYLAAPSDRGGLSLGHIGPVAEGAVGLVAVLVLIVLTRWIGERR